MCAVEHEDGRRLVAIEGELGMATVDGVRDVLLESFQAGENTSVKAAGLAEVDLAGLQLLCSAHRAFSQHGLRFRVEGMPEHVRVAARRAGFDSCSSTCRYRDGACLWIR